MNKYASWGIVATIVIALLWGITEQRTLTNYDVTIDKRLSAVQTSLEKRAATLESIANVTKSYMTHEQQTLVGYAAARAGAAKQNPVDPETGKTASDEAVKKSAELQKKLAENQAVATTATNQALLAINQVREAIPDLKADKTIERFTNDLKAIEKEIEQKRNYANQAIAAYDAKIRRFPGNVIAGVLGFEKRDLFKADSGSQKHKTFTF